MIPSGNLERINFNRDSSQLELRLDRVEDGFQIELEIKNVAKGVLGSFPLKEELALVRAEQLYGLAARLIGDGKYDIKKYADHLIFKLINDFGVDFEDYYKPKKLALIGA